MNTQKKNQPLIICKFFLSVIAIILLCSCSQVKTNPVRVNQTPSDSDAFVIQVSRDGRYYVYIPNETDRLKTTLLRNSKSPTEDSVWEVKLADIRNNIDIYKKATKCHEINLKIETDPNVEYPYVKSLMDYLQNIGYSHWNMTTKR